MEQNVLYKGSDDELLKLDAQATALLFEINTAPPEKRTYLHEKVFPKLFSKLGKNTWFEMPFNCDYGKFIEIGQNCFFNHHCSIGDGGKVKIGNNVWIGSNVTLLSGVKIGNNAVIGAGSVVTKDISDNTLAYGVPCKVVKQIA